VCAAAGFSAEIAFGVSELEKIYLEKKRKVGKSEIVFVFAT
jgi:hypothetical protein